MAKLVHYSKQWEFESDQEEKNSKLLSSANIQHIENELFMIRQQKENLKLDPTAVASFIQEESFLSGQIKAYQYLLDCHASIIEGMNTEKLPTEIAP